MKHPLQLLTAICLLPGALAPAQEAVPPGKSGKLTLTRYTSPANSLVKAGDEVQIQLAIRRTEGLEVEPKDLAVSVVIFHLTDNLDIIPGPASPMLTWTGEQAEWQGDELAFRLSYTVPEPDSGDTTQKACYGFSATLTYQGRIVATAGTSEELVPQQGEDGTPPQDTTPVAEPTEEAIPYSDFLNESPTNPKTAQ